MVVVTRAPRYWYRSKSEDNSNKEEKGKKNNSSDGAAISAAKKRKPLSQPSSEASEPEERKRRRRSHHNSPEEDSDRNSSLERFIAERPHIRKKSPRRPRTPPRGRRESPAATTETQWRKPHDNDHYQWYSEPRLRNQRWWQQWQDDAKASHRNHATLDQLKFWVLSVSIAPWLFRVTMQPWQLTNGTAAGAWRLRTVAEDRPKSLATGVASCSPPMSGGPGSSTANTANVPEVVGVDASKVNGYPAKGAIITGWMNRKTDGYLHKGAIL